MGKLQKSFQQFEGSGRNKKFKGRTISRRIFGRFFVKILGYTKPSSSSETKFNLTREYTNIKDSKRALALKTDIDATDKEIGQMVFALYGLMD